MNKSKEEFKLQSVKQVAEIIISSIPHDHPMIEKIEILEAPVTEKQQKKKDKKKKKAGEEEKEPVEDTQGRPQFINIYLRNQFLEQ